MVRPPTPAPTTTAVFALPSVVVAGGATSAVAAARHDSPCAPAPVRAHAATQRPGASAKDPDESRARPRPEDELGAVALLDKKSPPQPDGQTQLDFSVGGCAADLNVPLTHDGGATRARLAEVTRTERGVGGRARRDATRMLPPFPNLLTLLAPLANALLRPWLITRAGLVRRSQQAARTP